MILVVRVKLVLAEKPDQVLKSVKVALFDHDRFDQDDFLGSGETDQKGEARIVFDSTQYTDQEDQPAWRLESLPDLFVTVYNQQGGLVLSTYQQVVEDDLPKLITVAIPESLAEQHELLAE